MKKFRFKNTFETLFSRIDEVNSDEGLETEDDDNVNDNAYETDTLVAEDSLEHPE